VEELIRSKGHGFFQVKGFQAKVTRLG
jgi:hypothetical protein